jgi:ABC-type Co2+ transport system permease subunit
MHIEPGVVNGAKLALSYGTASIAFAGTAAYVVGHLKNQGLGSLIVKSAIATAAVFFSFEVMFHYPIGVSEVHLIFGTSLLLLFGVAPAALGLSLGLLIQGVFFAPTDLPQYGMNVTTLLVPLFALHLMVARITRPGQAYKDLKYHQVLRFSLAYQGGIIAWVAFWAFYGHGFNAENVHAIGTFGVAYLSVVLIEPIVDLVLLALAKSYASSISNSPLNNILLESRLFYNN